MFDNRLQPSNEPLIPSSYTTTEHAKPLFTLTAEEVEIVRNAMELQREMALELADALEPDVQHTETTLDNLLTRIKQWQDENNV